MRDFLVRIDTQTINVSVLIAAGARLAYFIQWLVTRRREVVMNVEWADFGAGALLSLCVVDDVEEDSLKILLILVL